MFKSTQKIFQKIKNQNKYIVIPKQGECIFKCTVNLCVKNMFFN